MALSTRSLLALLQVLVLGVTLCGILWSCGSRDSALDSAAEMASAMPRGTAPLELAAAASLTDLARDLAAEWERRQGTPVRVRLAGSSTLARQIRAGAAADLFLSASAEWVDGLDLVARRGWLGNRLVLVSATLDAPARLGDLDGLVLAETSVPLGRNSQAALEALGVPLPARVVRGAHARDVLSKVAQGAAEAGIVYATDAALDGGVRVLGTLPDGSHPPIRYEVALLTPAGRDLFDALDEAWVLELAARHGFLAP
jgi:molybdate transport system substrate-binding protein